MTENSDEPRLGDSRRRQQLAALEKSKRVRARRKQVRALARSGQLDPIALIAGNLDEWEDDVAGWRIEQLLDVVPGVGAVTKQEVFYVFAVSPRTKVRALTYERRAKLAKLLADALGRPYVR